MFQHEVISWLFRAVEGICYAARISEREGDARKAHALRGGDVSPYDRQYVESSSMFKTSSYGYRTAVG